MSNLITMQEATLVLHVLACLLAFVIYSRNKVWKYFAVMLLFVNAVGALFYAAVLFVPGFSGHQVSQFRALLQVLAWFLFSVSLVIFGGNHEH